MQLLNGSFKNGATGWTYGTGWAFHVDSGYDDPNFARFSGIGTGTITNDQEVEVYLGEEITAQCYIAQGRSRSYETWAYACLIWYDASHVEISRSYGPKVDGKTTDNFQLTSVTGQAPAGAAFVRFGVEATKVAEPSFGLGVDAASWDYTRDRTITLNSPFTGQEYEVGEEIPLRVTIGGTQPDIVRVAYEANSVEIADSTTPPYAANYSGLTQGSYSVEAILYLVDGSTVTSNSANIDVVLVVTPPDTREFKASNSYTYLVAENFNGLASSMPSTAVVTGVEVLFDYDLNAIIRAKDIGIDDLSAARFSAFFDIVKKGVFEVALLDVDGDSYTISGGTQTATVDINQSDFTVSEDGTSENKRFVSMAGPSSAVVVGSDTNLFGIAAISAPDFFDKAVGIRFYPELSDKPAYADSGDAVLRLFLNTYKVRVYFDAGSVEYCFASPDKTQIIKGRLVHSTVYDGDFRTGDASGVLHLAPVLTVDSGTTQDIGPDWTIHASCPPTDANKIGDVVNRGDGYGMAYSSLPGQYAVLRNRSRYEFTVENFYGDEALDSIYGVHGLPRAFAYNGEEFYKIYTQPDPSKDRPRHLAYHHAHLALGFAEGRVDISVVGSPYNFDGSLGASSHTIGDKVVGLLPLSGTILGIFGSKSIWGISGTTLDNFATQVIAPKIGATEYTITDMGFPVYANSYGVYTLAQVQQYGDYLGTPMSQDISPWIRPRLVRKYTSNKEVVVAWPVRSKNQYRIAFSDGYVATMTLNNGQQGAPTFSFQKYFITPPDGDPDLGIPLLEYPGIVPVAVSSELDDTGEERIHIVDGPDVVPELPSPPELANIVVWGREFSASGVGFDPTQTYNSELIGLSSANIIAYYSPDVVTAGESNLDVYPPSVDPASANLSLYTRIELSTPLELTTGNVGPGTIMLWADLLDPNNTLPPGVRLIVEVDTGSEILYGVAINSIGE